MIRWWRRKRKPVKDPELAAAEKRVDELTERAKRIVRDNHLARDIRKALGA